MRDVGVVFSPFCKGCELSWNFRFHEMLLRSWVVGYEKKGGRESAEALLSLS